MPPARVDEYLLPLILEGKWFRGEFCLDENGTELLSHDPSSSNEVFPVLVNYFSIIADVAQRL